MAHRDTELAGCEHKRAQWVPERASSSEIALRAPRIVEEYRWDMPAANSCYEKFQGKCKSA